MENSMYLATLERIKSAIYNIHPISDYSVEACNQAKKDVISHIEQMLEKPPECDGSTLR